MTSKSIIALICSLLLLLVGAGVTLLLLRSGSAEVDPLARGRVPNRMDGAEGFNGVHETSHNGRWGTEELSLDLLLG